MKTNELDALIEACLEGRLSETDAAKLSARLEQSAEARARYWESASIHGLLEHTLQQASLRVITGRGSPKPVRWLQWRPLAAAAAGIVFGMLCRSVVFGFVAQRHVSMQTLLKEGFEDADMVLDPRVPERAGVWSGDVLGPHETKGAVKPAEGLRMVTLPPVEKRKFSYAFRFVDLTKLPLPSTGQARQIEVTAQFHGAVPGRHERFQIRLAAFAEDVAGAREIWVRDHVDEQALLHVAKTVKKNPADRGWTTVRSVMDVPAGAKVMLVSLAAAVADSEATKTEHYLDDVQIRLLTNDAPLP